ncbi:hypothetical protein ACFQ1E_13405 [Sphingomonas canadensis]|uniref:DoxX family protein n=1 Tax=Sphingomonas canadensis TaxID=1219257 RepID=A0ABW3HA79_9SPHN|nr:hypothetical protein [Sphingomonas canadensis]MCW3837005.1 hypothetical protein [Sphingomonas canadensis]
MTNRKDVDDRIELALDADTLWKGAVTLMRLFLGAWMVVSGYSYWAPHFGLLPAFPQPLGTLPASNQMLVTLIDIGLFDFVKTIEIIGGLCLIFGIFVPAAVLLLLPVSAMVFYNAIFLNLRTDRLFNPTYMGVTCLYMNVIVALSYVRYYVPMLSFRSEPGSVKDIGQIAHLIDTRSDRANS